MKKQLVFLIVTLIAGTTIAKPNYREARDMYDLMMKSRYDTGLWHKKTSQESLKAVQDANAFAAKSEKLYGPAPSSYCTQAATYRREYVSALHYIHRAFNSGMPPKDFDMYAGLYHAVTFGEKMANCYDEVEALDPANKPRK